MFRLQRYIFFPTPPNIFRKKCHLTIQEPVHNRTGSFFISPILSFLYHKQRSLLILLILFMVFSKKMEGFFLDVEGITNFVARKGNTFDLIWVL